MFTEHLYISYDIYRFKQYITNIKLLRILITITTTAIMLVINNNNNNNNNNNYNCSKKKIRERVKLRRLPHTLTH